jgi:hypothetical protein
MDGFKKNPKIACFKEGGQVGYKSRKTAECDKADMKQDKAIVKKAVGQHEAMKHKGEGKTELKLKTGGRCKKDGGTVRKYKKGGEVIGMKKTAEDKKDIAGIKKKGSAPKKAAPKTKQAPTKPMGMAEPEMPATQELPMFEGGGNVVQKAARRLRDNVMGTPEQNAAARQQLDKVAEQPGMMGSMERGARAMSGMGQATPSNGMGQANPMGPGAMTDKERELLKGVHAIGRACGGAI